MTESFKYFKGSKQHSSGEINLKGCKQHSSGKLKFSSSQTNAPFALASQPTLMLRVGAVKNIQVNLIFIARLFVPL